MRYRVPKFIEREGKLVGPLTFKQLLYIGGGGLVVFITYYLPIPKTIFWLVAIAAIVVGVSLAFIKPGGRSMFSFAQSLFDFLKASKKLTWKKASTTKVPFSVTKKTKPPKGQKKILQAAPLSKLKKIKSKLDTKK